MCLLVLALGPTTALAQLVLAPVTPTTLAQTGWSELVAGDAAIQFVPVPSGGSFLPGSVQFTIGNPKDSGAQLQWSNTAFTFELTNLVALQYQTYVSSSGQCARKDPKQRRAIYVALDVDTDGDLVADNTLIFDPAVNGQIECDTWQTWDAKNGLWYWANDKKGPKNAGTIANLLTNLPGTKLVLGGIRFLAGFDGHEWKDFVGSMDAVFLEAPAICTITSSGISCVDGPSPTFDFGPDAP